MATTEHRFPPSTSDEYKKAREDLHQAELKLRYQAEEVHELRRKLPQGAVMPSYTFTAASDGAKTTLADLVADGRALVIYHLMQSPGDAAPCPGCAGWIDGVNGIAQHAHQHINLVVVAAAPASELAHYAGRRGWEHLPFYSSQGSDFNRDMGVEGVGKSGNKYQRPGVSVFTKGEDGKVVHFYTQGHNFGDEKHVDLDNVHPLWNLMDLVPEGRGDWDTENEYVKLKDA